MNPTEFKFLTDEQARQLFRQELEKFFADTPLPLAAKEVASQVVDLEGLLTARPFVGSRSTIYKKVSLGLIPHSKNGKKLYFDLSKIDEWLLSNPVKTLADLEQEGADFFKRKRKRRG